MWIKNNHHANPNSLINLNNVGSIDCYNQPLNSEYPAPYHIVFAMTSAMAEEEVIESWRFKTSKERKDCYNSLMGFMQVVTIS